MHYGTAKEQQKQGTSLLETEVSDDENPFAGPDYDELAYGSKGEVTAPFQKDSLRYWLIPRSPARAALHLCIFQLLVYIVGASTMILIQRESDSDDTTVVESSSSSSTASTVVSSPDEVDGGGWTLVRCVSSSEGSWHPATDNLYGTEAYGTASSDYTSDGTWSVTWDASSMSEYLFAYTDLSMWLRCASATVFEYGAPTSSEVLESSASLDAYTAEWYIREGNPEDPWVCRPQATAPLAVLCLPLFSGLSWWLTFSSCWFPAAAAARVAAAWGGERR